MRTVGEILSEKRKELKLSLEDIEKETKIRRKYLEAIEDNNFSLIQESTTVKGFIRNYALSLGLSAENVLAVFRRDFRENDKGQVIPRGMVESLGEKTFYWTPKMTFVFFVSVLVLGFAYFFVRQYVGFSSAPELEIFSPVEGQVINEKVEVNGKTHPEASVKIDGTLISISEDGTFKEEIILPRGENFLTIEAANRQGKKRTVNIKIKVE
jgi:cytoskeletal protein RodZ